MSLLKLSNAQDSEWYIPAHTHPFGDKSYVTKKFSPREKTKRKCEELNFFYTYLPIIYNNQYRYLWKYFDKNFLYSQIINIVIQKNPKVILKNTAFRRTAGLS